ncbi:hypothetical protein [Emcibacter nanhaiensis]|uniref:Uncharacterized protein n=1 Tax=Emcibacter nanhaiensis TaxID=1505037 RepID=A0A501PRQ0_9PROT|nr:hypothetical protein [Emcibacter nanhaiensis]TPD62797.1 hypothetical protein FIV46_01585 [Emcibacter nanhaiensis]
MPSIVPELIQDTETTQRIARVLLKHIRPKNKEEAREILKGRLGVYVTKKENLDQEIERYFN